MTTEYRWKTYVLRLLDIVRNRMLVKTSADWRQKVSTMILWGEGSQKKS